MKSPVLTVALLLTALPAAADDRAATLPPPPAGLLDPVGHPGPGVPPVEIEARHGWLTYTILDDARDALRRGQVDEAQRLLARARASAAATPRDPRLQDALDDVAAALRRGDLASASASLDRTTDGLRRQLIAADDRRGLVPPRNAPTGGVGYGSYGTSGAASGGGGSGLGMQLRGSSGGGVSTMSSGPNSSLYGGASSGPSPITPAR